MILEVKDGKFDEKKLIKRVKEKITSDGFYVITGPRKKRTKRSDAQNRYYWGVVIEMIYAKLRKHGYSEDEIHEILLAEFARGREVLPGVPGKIKRSRKMSTVEFNDYWRRIQRWAAEKLRLYIPDPKEIEEVA